MNQSGQMELVVVDYECRETLKITNYILKPLITVPGDFNYQNKRVGKGGRARNKSKFKKQKR